MKANKGDSDPKLSFDELLQVVRGQSVAFILLFILSWIWINHTRIAVNGLLILVICLFVPNQLFAAGCFKAIAEILSGIRKFERRS